VPLPITISLHDPCCLFDMQQVKAALNQHRRSSHRSPRSAGYDRHLRSVCTRRSAFTKNINVMLLSDGNDSTEQSLHEASLKAFETGFGKVLSCDEAKKTFAEHRQGSAMA